MDEPDVTHSRPAAKRWRAILDLLATVAMIVAAIVVIWRVLASSDASPAPSTSIPIPTEPVSFDGAPILGAPNARVAMLVFSDFECPFCARLANDVMPSLKQQYIDPGKVKVAFRNLPLAIHPRAERAAESAACAARQGRFWAMHDSLFRPPVRLEESDLNAHAQEADLDLSAFAICMQGEGKDRVSADAGIAHGLSLTGTPSILIGVEVDGSSMRVLDVFPGVRPMAEFVKAFDRALASGG
jgi:protein-disulfide isomerase